MLDFVKNIKGDKVIWIIVGILSIFSLLAVYSSTGLLAYKKQGGDTEHYLMRQFVILGLGGFLMYLMHLVKYTYFSRLAQIGLILTIPLLLVTLISGTNLNEANRWLTVPIINITFQSSDVAKLFLIMYVARVLSKNQEKIKEFKRGFLPAILPVVIICMLILPANFSTAAILFVTCIVLMFIGRVNLKYIMALMGAGFVGIILLLTIAMTAPNLLPRSTTWKNRIENFIDKDKASSDENYQVDQAKIAIVSGGLFGKSPGKSTQRNFLPHPYSDFIFAIIIEEYGIIGGTVVILLYLILFFRVIRIANKCPGNFGALLSVGIGFSLVFQALINMAVAVNLFPVTGQTLPLISMGGTSIWFTCISIGIILSVSRRIEIETQNGTEVDVLRENQPAVA
ncbi:FtsW/RodA/SpoVE family cell cycle protein [Bacteroidota bacterium]